MVEILIYTKRVVDGLWEEAEEVVAAIAQTPWPLDSRGRKVEGAVAHIVSCAGTRSVGVITAAVVMAVVVMSRMEEKRVRIN